MREGKYFERDVYEKFMKRKVLLEGKYLSWKGNSYDEKESIIRRKVSWKRKFYYKESIPRRKVL